MSEDELMSSSESEDGDSLYGFADYNMFLLTSEHTVHALNIQSIFR